MKNCKTCGKEFQAKDPRKQYCSDKCKWTFDNKKSLLKVAEIRSSVKIEDLPGEIWKDIQDYEGMYQISNLGRVKGLLINKEVSRGTGKIKYCKPERVLDCSMSNYGYKRCQLKNGVKSKQFFIHRLIASAFVPNPNNLDTVNHIDGDKLNNSISNLEWCTLAENTKHAFKTGLNKPYQRSNIKGIQKHSKQVQCAKTGKVWPSIKAACIDLNTNPSSLKRILNGISKSCSDYVYYNPTPSTLRNV